MDTNTLESNDLSDPKILLIGGIDPTIGAGLVLDSNIVLDYKLRPLLTVTAVTAQNSSTFISFEKVSAKMISEQLQIISKENEIAAVKIGMLGSRSAVEAVATFFEDNHHPNIVLDPILKSSSGYDLISEVGYQLLKVRLLPISNIITPNLMEAEKLAEMKIETYEEAKEAARMIKMLGPQNVLITGGHFAENDTVSDILYNGNKYFRLTGPRVEKGLIRGTGCLISTSIACNLGLKQTTKDAVTEAEKYCRQKIIDSRKIESTGVYQSDLKESEI